MDVPGTHQDGAEIRRLREKAGYGRTEFAGRAQIAASSLTNIENGNRQAGLDVLTRIAAALDVPVIYLVKPGTPLYAVITSSASAS